MGLLIYTIYILLVWYPGILYTKVWTSADIFLLWYHVCSPRTIQELFSSMTLQEYAIYPVKQNIVDTFDSIQETLFPYKQGVKAGATTTNWQSTTMMLLARCRTVTQRPRDLYALSCTEWQQNACNGYRVQSVFWGSFSAVPSDIWKLMLLDEMWECMEWSLVRCPASSFHDKAQKCDLNQKWWEVASEMDGLITCFCCWLTVFSFLEFVRGLPELSTGKYTGNINIFNLHAWNCMKCIARHKFSEWHHLSFFLLRMAQSSSPYVLDSGRSATWDSYKTANLATNVTNLHFSGCFVVHIVQMSKWTEIWSRRKTWRERSRSNRSGFQRNDFVLGLDSFRRGNCEFLQLNERKKKMADSFRPLLQVQQGKILIYLDEGSKWILVLKWLKVTAFRCRMLSLHVRPWFRMSDDDWLTDRTATRLQSSTELQFFQCFSAEAFWIDLLEPFKKVLRPLKASDAVHDRRWNWWWWHSKSDCWDPKKFPLWGNHPTTLIDLAEYQLFEDQKVPKAVTLKELLDAVCNCIHVYLRLPFPVVVLLPQTWEHLWKAWNIWYMLKAPPKLLLRPKPEETSDNSEKVVSFGRWISRISRWSYPQGLAVQMLNAPQTGWEACAKDFKTEGGTQLKRCLGSLCAQCFCCACVLDSYYRSGYKRYFSYLPMINAHFRFFKLFLRFLSIFHIVLLESSSSEVNLEGSRVCCCQSSYLRLFRQWWHLGALSARRTVRAWEWKFTEFWH